MIETSVLIVGAGPVGMGLGVQLDRLGIDALVIDRRATVSDHPKVHGCTPRTMEIFRSWGVDEDVRAGGLAPGVDEVWFTEGTAAGRVAGVKSLHRGENTPGGSCSVTQDVVEAALDAGLRRAAHAEVRRPFELVSFTQDEDGVSTTVRDLGTGEELEVHSRYLVGCDGAKSQVRETLGIPFEGDADLGRSVNYTYSADLSNVAHPRHIVAMIVLPTKEDPELPMGTALFGGRDRNRWQFFTQVRKGQPEEEPEILDADQLQERVRTLWGIPDLDVQLLNVMPWTMAAQLATTFRQGRVLLAGDAAHVLPPAGGLGMNSGIQDVQNLGWKLAFVLRGLASESLLDTFEEERRAAALSNLAWARSNAERFASFAEIIKRRHEDPLAWRGVLNDYEHHLASNGQSMGFIYESGALIDDGSALPPHDDLHYWPSDRPGARFPHMWLDVGWEKESTIDWFDATFTLVCGPTAHGWRVAGEELAAAGTPLEVRVLPTMSGPFTFGAEEAVLVRPDGYVAWRPGRAAADPAADLREALDTILGTSTIPASVR